MGADSKSNSFGRHDIRYTPNSSSFSELISILQKNGNQVGLHSAYYSSTENSYAEQKSLLEKSLNKKVICNRNHALNYNIGMLFPQLERAEIQFDMSIGYARKVGFKSGTCRAYRGIDFYNSKITNVREIPLVLMDNAFFWHPESKMLDDFKYGLEHSMIHNGCISVLFHPENMAIKPKLWNIYGQLIDICKQQGATILNAARD